MQIFISHAPEDDQFVNMLRSELNTQGYQAWVDHVDVPAGADWIDVISQVLRESQLLLFVISKHALSSIRVRKEWDDFLAHNRRIIPLKLDNSPIPLLLRDLPYVDFSDRENWQQSVAELVRLLPSEDKKEAKSPQSPRQGESDDAPASPPPLNQGPVIPPTTVTPITEPLKPAPVTGEEAPMRQPSLGEKIADFLSDIVETVRPARPISPIDVSDEQFELDDDEDEEVFESEDTAKEIDSKPVPPSTPSQAPGSSTGVVPRPVPPKREEQPPSEAKEAEAPIGGVLAPAPVMFSAYPPKVAKKDEWQPLLAYVFRETAAQAVIADALQQLGEKQSRFSQVTTLGKRAITEGAEIVARPTMAGFQFKPLEVKIGFYDDWQRFNFELRAKDAPLNQFATGNITFTFEGIVVADVPLSVYVGDENAVGELSSTVTRMYQAIFCSYSHQDTKIVERVERAYKALGLDYLRDITTLKSGAHWSNELLKLIDRADIFQLFWSPAAAESPYVRQEWEHALKLDRDAKYFIRPVYWQQPPPEIPDELREIHFAFQPDLGE